MNLLFLPKLLPRADIIGGPILIYHRIKNLSLMGHKITVIAPAYGDMDLKDRSLEPFCDQIIRIESVKQRSGDEVEDLRRRLKRPRFFLGGDGGFSMEIEDALKLTVREKHIDAVVAEYSMMGQYIEGGAPLFPANTMSVISVHECYTKAFSMRAQKGEDISEDTIRELFEYEFKMYDAADRLLSLTQEDADILTGYSARLKDKIRVVPHGVDTGFYRPPEEKSWDGSSKNLLYLGNFQHHPNVDAVMNFLEHCWDKISRQVSEAKFYAIGYKPPSVLLEVGSKHRNVIVQEGGDRENVRRIYWKSDVFVAPIALGTGFRGKLLEAMGCGLPVVATSLAAFGISPVHEEDMFVADDYDVFSEYVIRLLKDVSLRKRISDNSVILARKFDHKHAAEKLDQVLREGKGSRC
ncbi:MAG: glycosyltransferase family 4 protein [Candidatus Zixiibacteriota bacterium]|nr:MAG: glycosyltransferase family 4 protein [candidate division Zixibacteria bacterium]